MWNKYKKQKKSDRERERADEWGWWVRELTQIEKLMLHTRHAHTPQTCVLHDATRRVSRRSLGCRRWRFWWWWWRGERALSPWSACKWSTRRWIRSGRRADCPSWACRWPRAAERSSPRAFITQHNKFKMNSTHSTRMAAAAAAVAAYMAMLKASSRLWRRLLATRSLS